MEMDLDKKDYSFLSLTSPYHAQITKGGKEILMLEWDDLNQAQRDKFLALESELEAIQRKYVKEVLALADLVE
ncbi:protein of unknown function [Pseudodesulfovibrio profundus]|uniref:Uncharacterized protein n=1 Tax=Pseudodesulfovibrio profundus TaxID=57320 RepID=A0A2C8FAG8_9BACT|nr:hypothetical protein [Pseudodesulfovibrio profundus]SOB59635.1 protein of unknown function [Pseudodesulfovibrio profundus]